MAPSTFAVAVLMLMLPASARRNKDDSFAMEASISEARDPEKDLEFWLTTCGASLGYLQRLHWVLSNKMDFDKGAALPLALEYAKKQLDPDQLLAMYTVLRDKLGLSVEEARSRAPELLEKDASPTQLSDLYTEMTAGASWLSWLVKSPKEAQGLAMESAAAGCEPDKFKSAYQANHDKKTAAEDAIRASFDTQAYRYADDGRYYTAERFADYYKSGGDWVAKWTNSPVAQKVRSHDPLTCCIQRSGSKPQVPSILCVAEDGKAYSASQFKEFFKEGWLSKWNAATWATQRRVTEPDGKVYTLDEFASYFKSEWQQKWAESPVALCKECTAASHA
ncbi:hypothetical protein AK812_SmicGene14384 [Symbiodinium microadriaticum]|uniref:Uncharacterized protein n=2 Tax=Symbiodinium microadriaticum TaxID=2951 RepID=A0A1Q9E5M7_SYMMI|nr:hypothetical protein AK812_SmicGene14384 [Symbiodinium microadriaticum]